MAAIRQVEVSNFRGVREAIWAPLPGLNAIIGAGDNPLQKTAAIIWGTRSRMTPTYGGDAATNYEEQRMT